MITIKKISTWFLLLLIGIVLEACQKDTISYGIVNVTVVYQHKALPDAKVYLKKGTSSNPNILPEQYDAMATTDANGKATFTHLAPDNYFFLVEHAMGSGSARVLQRFRGDNVYNITIDAN